MSMFLPEGFGQTQQPQDGVASITPANPETTSEDIALMQRVFSAAMRNPNLIPGDFMSYIVDYIQTQRLVIPIGQVFGFSQYSAQAAPTIVTSETTTSTSYVDLSTTGPTLDALPAGKYIIMFGFNGNTDTSGHAARMAIEINSIAIADDNDCVSIGVVSPAGTSGARAIVATLGSTSGNSLVAKYKAAAGGTALFQYRWLLALKYAN